MAILYKCVDFIKSFVSRFVSLICSLVSNCRDENKQLNLQIFFEFFQVSQLFNHGVKNLSLSFYSCDRKRTQR